MLSTSQKKLLDAIQELHRFETSPKALPDLKAIVVELRSALAEVQGEMVAKAMRQRQPYTEALRILGNMFRGAIDACNTIALFLDLPTIDARSAATFLVVLGNFAGIESFLNTLEQ
jgi:hypothetical protein